MNPHRRCINRARCSSPPFPWSMYRIVRCARVSEWKFPELILFESATTHSSIELCAVGLRASLGRFHPNLKTYAELIFHEKKSEVLKCRNVALFTGDRSGIWRCSKCIVCRMNKIMAQIINEYIRNDIFMHETIMYFAYPFIYLGNTISTSSAFCECVSTDISLCSFTCRWRMKISWK